MSSELIRAITTKALDGLHARHIATAQNIANASSEDYSPLRVDFEEQLRLTVLQADGSSPSTASREIGRVQPTLHYLPYDSNQGVKIDQEITTASETSARYAMLIGMLSRSLQIENLAIKGG